MISDRISSRPQGLWIGEIIDRICSVAFSSLSILVKQALICPHKYLYVICLSD